MITLSNATLAENVAANPTVGTLSTTPWQEEGGAIRETDRITGPGYIQP